ncbi:MAG TPA: DNA polymerase III subunit beta [Solirubrobacteraceae bacterium]|nr:DNA polymerase III subunit beta [Solirubrobacteraceae bacterium]
MKLAANREDLLNSLQLAAHATSTRSTVGALSGVLLRCEGERISATATDLDVALRVPVVGRALVAGSALVPARLLVDVVRAAPEGELSCELDSGGGLFMVRWQSGEAGLRVLHEEEYPTLAFDTKDDLLTLPGDALRVAIGQVARAASRDETRPLLTGVLLRTDDSGFELVATDSYRLAVKRIELDGGFTSNLEATVPAHTMAQLSRILQQGTAERVQFGIVDRKALFKVGEIVISSRLLEGHFPDYRQLLPSDSTAELELGAESTAAVVRRIGLVAQRNAPLAVRLVEGELVISTKTPDIGEASERIPVPYSGEELTIGFNPTYLREGLDALTGDTFTLRLTNTVRPGIIESNEGGGCRLTYLVMPVRLEE